MITVTPPLAIPAPVLTASAGGDGTMTAGTYDVAVACANTSSYSVISANQLRSSAWLGQITITAGQKINVAYPAITNASHYNIYIKKSTETWYGGNRRVGTSDLLATTTLLSYDITTLNSRRPHFDFFSYDTTYFQPPISLNRGSFVIHISGTDQSAYYYADIYNALVSAGCGDMMGYRDGAVWWNGQIIVDSGATGALAWYAFKQTPDQSLNNEIHALQGIIVNNSSTFTMTWGTTQRGATLYQEAWSWNIETKNMDCTNLTVLAGNWGKMRAQTYIVGGDHYTIMTPTTGSTEYMNLKGSNVQNQKNGGIVSGISSNSSILASLENTTTENCTFETYGLTVNRTGIETLKTCTVGNVGFARHIRSRNFITGGIFLYGNLWKNNNTIIVTPGGGYLKRPEIYWEASTTGLANIFYQGQPFQVKVYDDTNNPLNGATVTLHNGIGTEFTETVSASGLTTLRQVIYESGQYDGSGVYGNGTGDGNRSWDHTLWTVRNFTLTITAPGYEDYVHTFNFDEPQYLKIKMTKKKSASLSLSSFIK